MVYALSKFVSIPSVSSAALHKEDCRQAAAWLRKCLIQLGAQASLVSHLRIHVFEVTIEALTLTTRVATYR